MASRRTKNSELQGVHVQAKAKPRAKKAKEPKIVPPVESNEPVVPVPAPNGKRGRKPKQPEPEVEAEQEIVEEKPTRTRGKKIAPVDLEPVADVPKVKPKLAARRKKKAADEQELPASPTTEEPDEADKAIFDQVLKRLESLSHQ